VYKHIQLLSLSSKSQVPTIGRNGSPDATPALASRVVDLFTRIHAQTGWSQEYIISFISQVGSAVGPEDTSPLKQSPSMSKFHRRMRTPDRVDAEVSLLNSLDVLQLPEGTTGSIGVRESKRVPGLPPTSKTPTGTTKSTSLSTGLMPPRLPKSKTPGDVSRPLIAATAPFFSRVVGGHGLRKSSHKKKKPEWIGSDLELPDRGGRRRPAPDPTVLLKSPGQSRSGHLPNNIVIPMLSLSPRAHAGDDDGIPSPNPALSVDLHTPRSTSAFSKASSTLSGSFSSRSLR